MRGSYLGAAMNEEKNSATSYSEKKNSGKGTAEGGNKQEAQSGWNQ